DAYIDKRTDMRSQVGGFLVERISLRRLPIQEGIDVFRRRISRYWDGKAIRPITNHSYPFSDAFFKYLYNYSNQGLRQSLNLLNSIWNRFRRSSKITGLFTFQESLKYVRGEEGAWPQDFSTKDLFPFEKDYLIDEFWSKKRFNTDTERSGFVESALGKAFEILKVDTPKIVDLVRVNQQVPFVFGEKIVKRRPDVYVEFFGALGLERKRAVEFQVKIYGPESMVKREELESSIQLLKDGLLDLVFVIIAGKGPDPRFVAELHRLEFRSRLMGLSPMNSDAIVTLYLLGIYDDLVGMKPSSGVVKNMMETILGMPYEKFVADLRSMPKNSRGELVEGESHGVPSESKTLEKLLEAIPEPVSVTSSVPAPPGDAVAIDRRHKDSWTNLLDEGIKEYSTEIKYIIDLVMNRKGKYKGQTTEDFLVKELPAGLSKPRMRKAFKLLPEKSNLFTRGGSSIVLSKAGEELYQKIGR
ncbi:MAG TPA: hypothetical protein VJ044_15990, partial [Candidatus Hodarchaeales archaeon]|nr:hypothetical protein [Candidatus Hodarchaeales archaeon]